MGKRLMDDKVQHMTVLAREQIQNTMVEQEIVSVYDKTRNIE